MATIISVSGTGFFFIILVTIGAVSSFASSFSAQIINGEVVVHDSKTGLVWQQNSADTNHDGSVTSAPYPAGDTMKWQDAMDYCKELEYAGRTDWRLPDLQELTTLVDYVRSYPAIDQLFQCESDYYWSASTYEEDGNEAWYIHFNFGSDHWKAKDKRAFVRCVRKDQ